MGAAVERVLRGAVKRSEVGPDLGDPAPFGSIAFGLTALALVTTDGLLLPAGSQSNSAKYLAGSRGLDGLELPNSTEQEREGVVVGG